MTTPAPDTARRVVLVGAAHIDRIARSGVTFHLNASNPGSLRQSVGGAAFNAAVALRRLGLGVQLVTARGGDAAATEIEAALEATGIEDAAITWLDRSTASYTAILDDTGELVAGVADMDIYELLTVRVLSRRHLLRMLTKADALLLDANLPQATLLALTHRHGDRPIAAIAVSPAKVMRLCPILPNLAMLFMSRNEALALLRCPDDASAEDIGGRLIELGAQRAVVTDGPRDAILLDQGQLAHQTPPPIDHVRDVTGAGDTLAAVSFAEWLDGRPFFEAARIGMVAAGLHISSGLPLDIKAACLPIADALAPLQPCSA